MQDKKRIRFEGNDTGLVFARGRRDYREHCDITELIVKPMPAKSESEHSDLVPTKMHKNDKIIIISAIVLAVLAVVCNVIGWII